MQLDESIRAKMKPPSSVQDFRKTPRCPSSEKLLRYRRQRLPIRDREDIKTHLRDCDFCSAELELLKRHRNEAEKLRAVEMPPQLRRVAESVFGINGRDLWRIAELTDRRRLLH